MNQAPKSLDTEQQQTAELRISLTPAERAILDAAGCGNTATWARLTLLAAAKIAALATGKPPVYPI